MIAIQVSHPDLGTRCYHYAAEAFTKAQALSDCRQWAAQSGYYGAVVTAL